MIFVSRNLSVFIQNLLYSTGARKTEWFTPIVVQRVSRPESYVVRVVSLEQARSQADIKITGQSA